MNDCSCCHSQFLCPVRPHNLDDFLCAICHDEDEGVANLNEGPFSAHVDSAEKLPEGDIMDVEDDIVVQAAAALPQPKVPSAAEVAAHCLTHLPYRSWCPHCVASRRPNTKHRSSSESQRADPLLVADYCFVRDTDDSECVTVLVARLYPSRAMLATVVDTKGPDATAVARLARFIRDTGYSKVIYKSDQEKSIIALFEEALKVSSREGVLFNPHLNQMVQEASAVGESEPNGKRKLKTFFYKSALETHVKCRIPVDHAVMKCMVEHVASVTNRFVHNAEAQTLYEAIHGQRFKGPSSVRRYSTMSLAACEPSSI